MAVVTTYICDVSGVQGKREEFVEVYIKATAYDTNAYQSGSNSKSITKLVHYDVAFKLGLVNPKKTGTEVIVEPTFESALGTLLKQYVDDLVYDSVSDAMSNRG